MSGFYIYSDKADIVSELVSFARSTGKEANVIVFDESEAEAVKGYGAAKINILKGSSNIPENYSKAIADFLKSEEAELFLVGATSRGRDIGARVAGYLDACMISDVLSISYSDKTVSTTRMMYGGGVVQDEIFECFGVVTVPAGKFEPSMGETSGIRQVEVTPDSRVALVQRDPIIREGVDLRVAERVVCVGLGLVNKDDVKIAQDLADVMGAELGCSRGVAEERHWLPVEKYIGISGALIKSKLYLSMGVSGQVQHMVGVRDAKIIVAVDNNDKAPIFKAADYGIVGDMYEVIPMLTEALKKAKG